MLPCRHGTLGSVPRFEPFVGLRYDTTKVPLEKVVAPPYDVMDEEERQRYADRHDRNIVRVDVPLESEGPGRYHEAAAALAHWRSEGTIVDDPRPSFTLYRMAFTDEAGRRRDTVGVIGGLEVVAAGATGADDGAGVLPHERTTPKASTDRLDLTRATQANLSPIWGLSLATGLTELLLAPGEPLGSVVDEDGVVHRVERVDDPARLAAIGAAVGGRPVLIADGHHRYGVSQSYQAERRADAGGAAGPYDLTLAYVGELVADQLSVEPIHRLLDGLPADRSWPDVLAPWFDDEPGGPATAALAASLVERDAVALVEPGGTATLLHPRADAFAGERDLDSVRLERAVEGVPHVLRYQHGVGNVLAALERGEAQAAVLIRPVSVREIERTAHEGLLMPPKSTFFTPKLRSGLVLRSMAG
jgi:uncharacterized protein (DUF1015 family)